MSSPSPPFVADAAQQFRICVDEVLAREAGYVDHPRDPGGCTNLGITRATLEDWRGQPTNCADVRALQVLEARQIYRARYWNGVRGDDLPAGVNLMVFDACVNSGPSKSARWLQQAVGVEVDGAIGPVTLAAVRRLNNAAALIERLSVIRLGFLRSLGTWPDFGRGWTNRVNGVRQIAIAMAGGR